MRIGKALALVAVIVFVLVGFGVTVGNLTQLEELSFGLAFLAASFLI
ncbi:MAG: hypothetical protein LH654_03110 [Thermoleophilia bacterium]|nr:hypothetical protein [Thermoleophilia bacterium]